MICTVLLFCFLIVASYTDIRWRTVHNVTTYSGILVALAGAGIESLGGWAGWWSDPGTNSLRGFVPLSSSIYGMLACGAVMLVSYILLPGGVGGGDLKLLTMIGAFLGTTAGLEAMLWTLVIGGCLAVLVLVWREGFLTIAWNVVRFVGTAVRQGTPPPLDETAKKTLKMELFLSPSALLAVVIVRFGLIEWF
jgi:Flp pilus assembly protein protease CpaA